MYGGLNKSELANYGQACGQSGGGHCVGRALGRAKPTVGSGGPGPGWTSTRQASWEPAVKLAGENGLPLLAL